MKLNKLLIAAMLIGAFAGQCLAQVKMVNNSAGNGTLSFSGDGGPAVDASLNTASGLCVDRNGVLYIADNINNRIRKVYGPGLITTIAGSGAPGIGAYAGDGGPATAARFNTPFGVAVDTFMNIYVADNQNFRIRKIDASGIVTTIGGTGVSGYSGDGMAATLAKISYVHSLCIDVYGNLYFADVGNHVVRKISAAGNMYTVAGNGVSGFSGDGGAATLAMLTTPRGVKADAAGNVYIADPGNGRVRKVDAAGIITTLAGGGTSTLTGVPATDAVLITPSDVAIDRMGNVFIAESTAHRVCVVNSGMVSAHYFTGVGSNDGDGCKLSAANIYWPMFLATDSLDNLYVSDASFGQVRKISNSRSPVFESGDSLSFTICMDSTIIMDGLMSVTDSDRQQNIDWILAAPASHGTATAGYSTLTTGELLAASGIYYTPNTGFSGTDVFNVVVKECTGYTDTMTVVVNVVNCTLGVPAAAGMPKMQLSPNPSQGTLTFALSAADAAEVKVVVTNVLGQTVAIVNTVTNRATPVALNVPGGMYIVTAYTQMGAYSARMVVSKNDN